MWLWSTWRPSPRLVQPLPGARDPNSGVPLLPVLGMISLSPEQSIQARHGPMPHPVSDRSLDYHPCHSTAPSMRHIRRGRDTIVTSKGPLCLLMVKGSSPARQGDNCHALPIPRWRGRTRRQKARHASPLRAPPRRESTPSPIARWTRASCRTGDDPAPSSALPSHASLTECRLGSTSSKAPSMIEARLEEPPADYVPPGDPRQPYDL